MGDPKNVVDILRHARHDWLNKLQLIKGNLELGKTERAKEIIDEIIIEARHESDLSNIGLNQFSTFLLTYNWKQHFFILEFEVLELSGTFPLEDQYITNWLKGLFQHLEESLNPYGENHVSLSIEVKPDWSRFIVDIRGEFLPDAHILNYIHMHPITRGTIEVADEMDSDLSIEITIS
ncbi:sporulation initiation phosphotransferase B [Bacillus carboniphilus]|uniref:Sporulation initiation phosphotransferase B n=1 Tax=Bacillus carboniphilus TaxID=86663 RepID=A0ABP3G4A4_9BACI